MALGLDIQPLESRSAQGEGGISFFSFFFDLLQKFKEYSRLCLGKWASPAYDTVDPRNAGHMAKTQSSHGEGGLSVGGGGVSIEPSGRTPLPKKKCSTDRPPKILPRLNLGARR